MTLCSFSDGSDSKAESNFHLFPAAAAAAAFTVINHYHHHEVMCQVGKTSSLLNRTVAKCISSDGSNNVVSVVIVFVVYSHAR